MQSIAYALVSLITWGTGDIFTTFAARKMGALNAAFYGYLFGTLLSTLYLPFALNSLHTLTLPTAILTIFLGIILLIAFFTYNQALKIGNPALVGTISGSFTSIVVILSLIFLGETLSIPQVLAIVVIFVGLLLATINFSGLRKAKGNNYTSILLALFTLVSWAIYFTFIKIPVKESGFFWPSYISNIVGTFGFLIIGFKAIKRPKINIKDGLPAAFMSGFALTVGTIAYNIAISKGLAAIVAPVAGAYPALFALLAYFIFKDTITKQQKIGMVVILVGIVLLSYLGR